MNTGWAWLIVDLLGPLIIVVAVLAFLIRRRRFGRTTPVEDAPEGEPYSIYTTARDLELRASELGRRLPDASPDWEHGWYSRDHAMWLESISRFEALLEEQDEREWREAREKIAAIATDMPSSEAIVSILIDQSGSMKGSRMAWATIFAKRLTEILSALDIKSEVLGFSTAGWHGGFAYLDWKRAGKPARPGRLCALLHVVYKAADGPFLSDESCKAMMDPALLRENVDGEALLWAAGRLAERPEPRKHLLVISDGAPVDDATLMHNGPSFLWRHLSVVLGDIRACEKISLGGLGISHKVSDLYPASYVVEGPGDLPTASGSLLPAMLVAGFRQR